MLNGLQHPFFILRMGRRTRLGVTRFELRPTFGVEVGFPSVGMPLMNREPERLAL